MASNNSRIKYVDEASFEFGQAINVLSGGDVRAQYALKLIVNNGLAIDPEHLSRIHAFLELDKHGVYGCKIWKFYETICNKNLLYVMAILYASRHGILPWESVETALQGEADLDIGEILRQVQERAPDFGANSSC